MAVVVDEFLHINLRRDPLGSADTNLIRCQGSCWNSFEDNENNAADFWKSLFGDFIRSFIQ